MKHISVRSCYKLMTPTSVSSHPSFWRSLCLPSQLSARSVWQSVWRKDRDRKVNDFMWLLLHNALPLGSLLKRWSKADTSCLHCPNSDETTLHLFLSCPLTFALWQKAVLVWNKISMVKLSISPLLIFLGLSSTRHKRSQSRHMHFWHLISATLLHTIWVARCSCVFEKTPYSFLAILSLFKLKLLNLPLKKPQQKRFFASFISLL